MAVPVNFTLRRGEHIAIYGKNGSGKTRLVDNLRAAYPLQGEAPVYDFAPSPSPHVSDNVRYVAFRDIHGDGEAAYYQQRWNKWDETSSPTVAEALGDAAQWSEEISALMVGDDAFCSRQLHLLSSGGIGPCGRELCCATWMKNFVSVSTNAARFQDIAPNPQKLAGQCAKLKCCLNYEADTYVEAYKRLPSREVQLETADATFYYFKADILSGMVSYSTDKRMAANVVTIPAQRAFEIIRLNKQGEKPLSLQEEGTSEPSRPIDLLEQDSLTRFDKAKRRKNKKRKPGHHEGENARREERRANGGGEHRNGQNRERRGNRKGGNAPREEKNSTPTA